MNAIAAAKVTIALTRLAQRNLSKAKGVGGGVLEYKIDFGPGYRFYFGKDEERLVILISGGTKKRQDEDINRARRSIACREVQNSVAETKCLLHSDPMNSLEMSASFSKSKMRNRKIRALFSDSTRLTNPYEMSYAIIVITLTASDARERLYRLLDETAEAHEPVLITGPRSNAVLVSEKDWNAMQETVYLLSVPGMRESIRLGMATPIEECDGTPGW